MSLRELEREREPKIIPSQLLSPSLKCISVGEELSEEGGGEEGVVVRAVWRSVYYRASILPRIYIHIRAHYLLSSHNSPLKALLLDAGERKRD